MKTTSRYSKENKLEKSIFLLGKEMGTALNSDHQCGGMVLHRVLCTHLQPSAHTDTSALESVMGCPLCAQHRVSRKLADTAEGLQNLVQSIAL